MPETAEEEVRRRRASERPKGAGGSGRRTRLDTKQTKGQEEASGEGEEGLATREAACAGFVVNPEERSRIAIRADRQAIFWPQRQLSSSYGGQARGEAGDERVYDGVQAMPREGRIRTPSHSLATRLPVGRNRRSEWCSGEDDGEEARQESADG